MTLFQPLDIATIDINISLSGRLPKEVRAPVSRMSQTSGRGHRLHERSLTAEATLERRMHVPTAAARKDSGEHAHVYTEEALAAHGFRVLRDHET